MVKPDIGPDWQLRVQLQVLLPVPPVAWIPIIIVVFGIGEESKVALIERDKEAEAAANT